MIQKTEPPERVVRWRVDSAALPFTIMAVTGCDQKQAITSSTCWWWAATSWRGAT